MRRLALGLAAVLAAAPVAGQQILFQHVPSGDSATVILTGDTGTIQLRALTCDGVSAYALRLYYDPARLTVLDADSIAGYSLPKPTLTPGTGYVDIAASGTGYNGCTTFLADVHLQLDAGATAGDLLSLRILSLTDYTGNDLLAAARAGLGQVCQAEVMWGDADSTRTITSRDGLVLLSAAVGLPTPGFSLATGDVDGDRAVTTRDALLVLSRAIGLYGERAGLPRANRCAPLIGSLADAAYRATGGVWVLPAGDTVPQLLGFNPVAGYRLAWAPDGSRVLFMQSISGWSYDFIAARADGSGADTLFVATGAEYAPAWSPDGSRIAFMSSRVFPNALFVMDADAQNQIQLTDSLNIYETAWTPDGSEIVVTAYHQNACCTRRLWAVAADGSGYREVFATSGSYQPQSPTVSPAGDSVSFQSSTDGTVWAIPLTGGTTPARISQLIGNQYYPGWATGGWMFRGDISYPYGFYALANNGRYQRVLRGDPSTAYGDLRLRTAGVWIETVDIDVDSTDVAGSTFQLNVTVTNSDASVNATAPVRWVSRDTTIVTVDQTGLVTNLGGGGLTWIVATTGGWRSDSTRINALGFAPPAMPVPGRQP